MAKQKENSTQKCFNAQAAIDKAEKDLLTAKDAHEISSALARGSWLKLHPTEPQGKITPSLGELLAFIDDQGESTKSKWGDAAKDLAKFLREKMGGLPEGGKSKNFRRLYNETALFDWFVSGAIRTPDEQWANEVILHAHKAFLFAMDLEYKGQYPLASIMEAWIKRPRRIDQASASTVNDTLIIIPRPISETNRTRWQLKGEVKAVLVDGEPIGRNADLGTYIDEHQAGKRKARKALVHTPAESDGQISLIFKQQRMPGFGDTPIPLIAFKEYGGDLRQSIAFDVAQLLCLTFASDQDLIMDVKEGTRLLTRGKDGKFRRIKPTDEQRFEQAFLAVWGMGVFLDFGDGVSRFFPLTNVERIDKETVKLAKPLWYKNEKEMWTLSAGFGKVGAARLSGKASGGGIWRFVAGSEYFLARDTWAMRGPDKRIAKALLPANGKTGAGQWQKLGWKAFLAVGGDIFDWKDVTENAKARKRFERLKGQLKAAKYVTESLGRKPAEAGDTVEFHFAYGQVSVRATARFVEGAKLAQKQQWEHIKLTDYYDLE